MKNKFKRIFVLFFSVFGVSFVNINILAKTAPKEAIIHSFLEEYDEESNERIHTHCFNNIQMNCEDNSHQTFYRNPSTLDSVGEKLNTQTNFKTESILSSLNQNEMLSNEPINSFVSGYLTWSDGEQEHPLQNTLVRIQYSNSAAAVFPQYVYTNESGNFFAIIPLTEAHNVMLQIYSEGKNSIVKNNTLATSYHTRTAIETLNPGGTVSFDFCIDETNTDIITRKAFQVFQALNIGTRYIEAMTGKVSPFATCHYPANSSQYNLSSDVIDIKENDYLFWDIILHEFGHKIQQYYGIADNIGGSHNISEDLIARYGKSKGIKLAWSEGWATFFSILVTQYFGEELEDIVNVNDEKYDSYYTSPEDTWNRSLETPISCAYCEGNELSVAAVLYDLYDSYSVLEPGDTISLSHKEMFNAAIQSHATSLSEFLNYFFNNYYSPNDGEISKILTEYGMASTNVRITNATLSSTTPPTISWESGGLGACKFNEFQVVFYNSNQMVTLLTTARQAETTLTLTYEQWKKILDAEAIKFYIAVVSYQTSSPSTGPYYSSQLEVWRPEDAQHIHIYSYESINSRIHQVTCRCGESFEQSHTFIPEGLGQRCKYCNYYANASIIIPGIKNVKKDSNIVMYLKKELWIDEIKK